MVRINEITQPVNQKETKALLRKHFKIEGTVTIDENGYVSVAGSCQLGPDTKLDLLPVKFLNVTDSFYCAQNQLTSLEGAPRLVGNCFFCGQNQLTSLQGAPQSVGGDLSCVGNDKLTSLEGMPKTLRGYFMVSYNKDLPLLRVVVCKQAMVEGNDQVESILNKYVGNPSRSNIIACQNDLIANGFEGNAKW